MDVSRFHSDIYHKLARELSAEDVMITFGQALPCTNSAVYSILVLLYEFSLSIHEVDAGWECEESQMQAQLLVDQTIPGPPIPNVVL